MSSVDLKDLYTQPPPAFGREARKYFALDPEYANLNNGSYGTTPKPVLQAALELSSEIEANPDLFHRLTYQPILKDVRAQLGKLIGAHTDECVLVTNATTGINTILRNFDWKKGDILIAFSTTYSAVSKTVTWVSETLPHPTASIINLTFPTTQEEILETFTAFLRSPEAQVGPNNKRVAVIDSIISNPGILLPWKEMVKVCKEEGVWSVIDAAHSIGQELDINLSEVQPDFWVSNCHKWLSAKRACAVLYVPFRNQHMIKTSIPTSTFYTPVAQRNGDPNFVDQFEWYGTIDYTPYLTLRDALAFRAWLGGEHKINAYCHDLALKGGRHLAEVWGTQLMDPEGKLTLNMVNVELPLPAGLKYTPELNDKLNSKLLLEYNAYSAWYFHNGKWWTRCSVQVFNDMQDFERLGKAWLEVSKGVTKEFEQSKDAS